MTTRRNFIKTAAMGTVALASASPVHALEPLTSNNTGTAVPSLENALNEPAVGKWAYSFDEREFKLFLSNSSTELVAGISFKSGDKV